MKISITEALVKLKTLGNRINSAISAIRPIALVMGKNSPLGFKTTEEFETAAKAAFQSAQGLIKYHQTIKGAIVAANAVTNVTIGGKVLTVAQAIERKNSIQYEKDLLKVLSQNYASVLNKFVQSESDVQMRLQKLLEVTFGKDTKTKGDEVDNISKPFLEANSPKLVDPLNLKSLIESLEKDIAEFEGEVDFRLSEANAMTTIEVPG
jgi:hypothetical protein